MMEPATQLGHYTVLALIGKGGMGEVWRARDTELQREVALKVSASQFSERFQREARVIASLNHPNVCTLYEATPDYLVMELVEGVTLEQRIQQGPIPPDEAISIARQIAAALDYAHDRMVVHRDLKPANIKIRPDGLVKVLDFGLAKPGQQTSLEDHPTVSLSMSQAGAIVGTPAYMSPEQAAGGVEVDRRTDIWAMGVVLYEMLTGQRLFKGDTISHVLASVLKDTPQLDAIPAKVRPLLAKCLEKDPKKRLRAAGDMDLLIEDERLDKKASRWPMLGWAAAGVMSLVAIVLGFTHLREVRPPASDPVQYSIVLPDNVATLDFTISPDGRYLAYTVGPTSAAKLWIRVMATGEVRAVPGGDSTGFPFWSPDSASIGFCANGKLRIAAATGGPSQPIADCANWLGGAWSKSGVILLGSGALITGGISKVSAQGGTLATLLPSPKGRLQSLSFLPDQNHFLFTNNSGTEEDGIYVGSLAGDPPVRILSDLSTAVFVPSRNSGGGDLLFVRDGNLVAQSFDPATLGLTGGTRLVAERISPRGLVGTDAFTVSNNGSLVYYQLDPSAGQRELVWMDRAGRRIGMASKPEAIGRWSLSPNDDRVLADRRDESTGKRDIWVLDIARMVWTRLTTRNEDQLPAGVWSPDGTRVTFVSRLSPSSRDIYWKLADGIGREELLFHGGSNAHPQDWSRDNKWFVYTETTEDHPSRIFLLPLEGDPKKVPYLTGQANEIQPQLSPDGHWMAYASDESGQYELYVQSVPVGKGKFQISTAGGTQPRWRRDGGELFFVSGDGTLMAAPVKPGAGFDFGTPRELFQGVPSSVSSLIPPFTYEPAKDGQRFMVSLPSRQNVGSPSLSVLLNWQVPEAQ